MNVSSSIRSLRCFLVRHLLIRRSNVWFCLLALKEVMRTKYPSLEISGKPKRLLNRSSCPTLMSTGIFQNAFLNNQLSSNAGTGLRCSFIVIHHTGSDWNNYLTDISTWCRGKFSLGYQMREIRLFDLEIRIQLEIFSSEGTMNANVRSIVKIEIFSLY